MIKRDVVGRYKGSTLGLAWSIFNPIFMLAIYTIIFSEVFKLRWNTQGESESRLQFALMLFVGLIILNLFNEVISRAPTLVVQNVNYVKKVVFPIEILPIMAVGSALFHALISLGVLIITFALFNGFLPLTFPLIVVVLTPFLFFLMGLSWLLASLGVFIRDISQSMGLVVSVMTFLSPVFYPLTAVPEKLRWVILLNPLTFIIEQSRSVLLLGILPDWAGLALYTIVSLLMILIGYAWFQKTRRGFADVL